MLKSVSGMFSTVMKAMTDDHTNSLVISAVVTTTTTARDGHCNSR